MRKIVLFQSVSVDGFTAGPNGELDWHRVDGEFHGHCNAVLGAMSAFLQGRVTHELMVGVWPTADQDPASPATMVEFARIWRDMPKIVFSRSLERVDWCTRLLREVVPEEILELKAQPGGDMALGGADLAASFGRLGLIDEYRVYVHPVLVGRGHRLFWPSDARTDLGLVETRTFGSGVVLLRYASAADRAA